MAEDSLFSDDGLDEDYQLFSSNSKEIDVCEYRSFSSWAVVSLVLALVGLAFFVLLGPDGFILYAPIQIVGLLLGMLGLFRIRRNSFELTGEKLAKAGISVSALFLVIGGTWASIVYLTEVPEGYDRISFYTLDNEGATAAAPISEEAAQYHGKPIFIKGYVHPGVNGLGNITRFVLVGDLSACCFGGQPKPWDMVEVELKPGHELTYDMKRHRVWGTMTIDVAPHLAVGSTKEATGDKQLQGGFYRLEADGIK